MNTNNFEKALPSQAVPSALRVFPSAQVSHTLSPLQVVQSPTPQAITEEYLCFKTDDLMKFKMLSVKQLFGKSEEEPIRM